jgi:outer membrane usher protein FimD/PapC
MPFGRTGAQGYASLSDSRLLSGVRMHDRIREHTDYSASIQRDHALREMSGAFDVNHRGRLANVSANVWRASRASSYSATLSGALAVHGSGFGFSPYPITDTFGIVSTSGVPGVQITTRAGVIETDSRGQAILPSLPAYATSPVEIATRSLPRNADVDNGYKAVQPARGSVQKVHFNVTRVRRALLDVTTEDGVPIQRGSQVLDSAGNMVATVLGERRVFISRAVPDEPLTVQLVDGRRCRLAYTLSDQPDPKRTFERVNARCIPVSDER